MFIGELKVENEVLVTDPCYEKDIWCSARVSMPKANYLCYAEKYKGRISSLYMIDENYEGSKILIDECKPIAECGVDSGQLGFFIPDKYQKKIDKKEFNKFTKRKFPYSDWKRKYNKEDSDKDSFYRCCCNVTLSKSSAGVIKDVGCLSSSGYGDGCYNVYYTYNDKKEKIGLLVEFMK